MSSADDLTRLLKQKALELGFSFVGVIAANPARRLDAYLSWISAEMHGKMGYLAREDRIIRRQDLNVILPDVKSIVCVGLDYATVGPPETVLAEPSRGRISNYAWGTDYHDVMAPKLKELAQWLSDQSSSDVASKVYVDTGAILERDHAEQAGFGFTGKNTMLIQPRQGSFFFLGELLTTEQLAPDEMAKTPGCGTCTRCLSACPTDAFPKPFVLDARRCISYLTIELKGWVPRDLRPLMGNWIYGCDVCQTVCPFNRFASPRPSEWFSAETLNRAAPSLISLLRLDNDGFNNLFANSPIKRIKRRRLVRNACIAAGNWGVDEVLPALLSLLEDQEPLIRGHAGWAIGRIQNPTAIPHLERCLAKEKDPEVRAELEASLNMISSKL